jgi:acetyltransferase-like isoleucine patch superfamily enzyme
MVPGARTAVNQTNDAVDKTEFQARLMSSSESGLRKYTSIAVGRPGIVAFLRYELACWLLSPMPGALGLLLRSKFYPGLLGSSGGGIVFGRNVCLRHPGKVRLGRGAIIDDNCVLDAKGELGKGIVIGDGAMLGRNTSLSCKGGEIRIGDNSNIGPNCMLISESSLSIGQNVLVAGMTYIIAGGNHSIGRTDIPIIRQPMVHKGGVCIEDNCWLGANVTVLDGVTIGRDSVIGAGAVVTESVPEFSIAVGVPARVVKTREGRQGDV